MIINLTQHNATAEQKMQGLEDVGDRELLQKLLTVDSEVLEGSEDALRYIINCKVDSLVSAFVTKELMSNAEFICNSGAYRMNAYDLVREAFAIQILVGGMPTLVDALVKRLKALGCVPVYALSARVSEEVVQSDGTVTKNSRFKHIKFIAV